MATIDLSCDLTHFRIDNIINQILKDISRMYNVDIHSVFLPRSSSYNIYCNYMCITFPEIELWALSHSEILNIIIRKFNLGDDNEELNSDNQQAFIDAGEDLIFGGII